MDDWDWRLRRSYFLGMDALHLLIADARSLGLYALIRHYEWIYSQYVDEVQRLERKAASAGTVLT